jgi:SOS-response transcriptional repressor LexA
MNQPLPAQTYDILQAIIAYKTEHDGVSPSLDELAVTVTMVKSQLSQHISRLCKHGLLFRTPGQSRNLAVTGGQWAWAAPKLFPSGRIGDVLRIVVKYKTEYDGNAPSHRQIAQTLGLAYTGDISMYLDELAAAGYLTTAYATDRHIAVIGGRWVYDTAVIKAAAARVPRQGGFFSPK